MNADELAALDRAAQAADDSNDGERSFAMSQQFCAALLTAYRTGQLVLIDDGAVERVARALAQENGPFPTDDWKHYTNRATAAIAALGGK